MRRGRIKRVDLDAQSALSSRDLTMRALRQGARGERYAREWPRGVFDMYSCTHGRMLWMLHVKWGIPGAPQIVARPTV